MNYFYRRRLTTMAEQIDELERGIGFLIGVLQFEQQHEKDIVLQMAGLKRIAKAEAIIKQALRDIACFEYGAAYYDYIHSNQAEASAEDVLKQLTGGK